MKVRELIEALESYDPDAEVYLMTQPSWPFEYAVDGVVSREEMVDDEDDEATEGVTDGADYRDGEEASDVFIVEGSQVRYGSKRAWEKC